MTENVTVTGVGTAWSMTGDLFVGVESRAGNLSITNGAQVSSASASVVGYQSVQSKKSVVKVAGLGSIWSVAGTLAVHNSDVRVDAGATITADQGIIVTGSPAAQSYISLVTSTLTLAGGTLDAASIQLGTEAQFDFQSGTLRLDALTLSPGQFLGTNYALGTNRLLDIDSTTTLTAGSTFTIAGGHFRTGILAGPGNLAFTSGTLELTGQDLVIDDSGLFGDFLSLGDGRNFVVAQDVVVAAGAQFSPSGSGSLTAGRIINNGQVLLGSFATNVDSDEVVNSGLILGNGRLQSNLDNKSSGQVRVSAGDLMQFSGAASENAGALNILGGALEFGGTLVNSASGVIAGRGTLIVGNQLDNAGRINVSGGVTDIIGDVRNLAGGRIIVTGGSTLTLFDDFVHNGAEFRVSTGSAAVFLGAVSGAGPYTGAGTKFFEGTFAPGNSPAHTVIEGDAVFGSGNTLVIELAGAAPGSGYDVVEVGGTATLGGTLRLELLDGYVPDLGEVYTVLLGGLGFVGSFDQIVLPTLAGYSFDLIQGSHSLAFAISAAAVPIPASAWLLVTAGALLVRRRRVM